MYTIYGLHTPMFVKVVLAAEEMKAPYKVVEVDLIKGEQKSPEHLKRQPFGKVPALEHNGRSLFESNAIIKYMADTMNSSFYPKSSYDRAEVDQWVDYFSLQAGRWCTAIWFNRCIGPKYFDEPIDEKLISENLNNLLEAMPSIDSHLAKNKWLAGSNISLADVNAFILMQGFRQAEIDFDKYQHFNRWFNEYSKRPAVAAVEKWQ